MLKRYCANSMLLQRSTKFPKLIAFNKIRNFVSITSTGKKQQFSNGSAIPVIYTNNTTLLTNNYESVNICTAFICNQQQQQRRSINTIPVNNFPTSWFQTLSNTKAVNMMQDALIDLHDYTGLPWWASIICATILFRTAITLPLTIYQHIITARLENLSLEMPAIIEELKKEAAIAKKKFQWTDQQTKAVYLRSVRKQWRNLIVRDNCHPAKTFIVIWSQIPLWIIQSMALRNIIYMMPNPMSLEAQILYSELSVGGFGWIPNLIEVDNSYILPVAFGLLNLSIIEIQTRLRSRPAGKLQKIATNGFRLFSIIMVPIACSMPSALVLYWTASSSYGLMQNLLLISPTVRRLFRIPLTKNEISKPYEHLFNAKMRNAYLAERTKANEPPRIKP